MTGEKLALQMEQDGVPLPEHLEAPPTLTRGLELFYNAFQDLTSCRAIGMSVGPIPWTAVLTYCVEHDIVDLQREDMFFHIDAVDTAYRADLEKKIPKGEGTK